MLLRRLNPWLASAAVVAVGACGLNPQPDLPNNDKGSSGNSGGTSSVIDTGGTSSEPTPGAGLGAGGETDGDGGKPAETPDDRGDGGSAGHSGDGDGGGSGGDSHAGAAGQSGADGTSGGAAGQGGAP